jgi:SPP1 gp7 family putative phage head morphogenesis protein
MHVQGTGGQSGHGPQHDNFPKQTPAQRNARTKATALKAQAVLDAAKQMNKSAVTWDKTWMAEPDACDICLPLDGETVPVSEPFRSGDMTPPAHPNCRCDITLTSRNL